MHGSLGTGLTIKPAASEGRAVLWSVLCRAWNSQLSTAVHLDDRLDCVIVSLHIFLHVLLSGRQSYSTHALSNPGDSRRQRHAIMQLTPSLCTRNQFAILTSHHRLRQPRSAHALLFQHFRLWRPTPLDALAEIPSHVRLPRGVIPSPQPSADISSLSHDFRRKFVFSCPPAQPGSIRGKRQIIKKDSTPKH